MVIKLFLIDLHDFKLFFYIEAKINVAIEEALKAAKEKGITGKEVTPFILASVSKITAGKSLDTSKTIFNF